MKKIMKKYDLDKNISPLNRQAMLKCKEKWSKLAKPIHGMGRLEDTLIQIAGITGSEQISLEKKVLVVFCADNGVVEEGVTQTGQEVTAIVSENFLSGKTSACIMAECAGTDVYPVDIGIAVKTILPTDRKIRNGTGNIAKGSAMTRTEAWTAICTGIEIAGELKQQGYSILLTGEMGIGNTTTSSAVTAVLLEQPVKTVTGRGAGLTEAGWKRKIQVIETAIKINKPDKGDPLDVLAKVGGLDLAGLTGLYLGGAIFRIPVVIDGFIAAAAALLAVRMNQLVSEYIIPSHQSQEPACQMIMKAIGKEAFLHCGMNLGEGTGALALCPLLDMAEAVYSRMETFENIDIEPYEEKGWC